MKVVKFTSSILILILYMVASASAQVPEVKIILGEASINIGPPAGYYAPRYQDSDIPPSMWAQVCTRAIQDAMANCIAQSDNNFICHPVPPPDTWTRDDLEEVPNSLPLSPDHEMNFPVFNAHVGPFGETVQCAAVVGCVCEEYSASYSISNIQSPSKPGE